MARRNRYTGPTPSRGHKSNTNSSGYGASSRTNPNGGFTPPVIPNRWRDTKVDADQIGINGYWKNRGTSYNGADTAMNGIQDYYTRQAGDLTGNAYSHLLDPIFNKYLDGLDQDQKVAFEQRLAGTQDWDIKRALFESLGMTNTPDQQADAWKNWLERLALEEQRQYDAPTSQLGRLMDTGMSRLQAMQLMSGAGSSATTIGSVASTSPSQSSLANEQKKLSNSQIGVAVAQTATSIIGLALSAVTGGISSAVAGVTSAGMEFGLQIEKQKYDAQVEAANYRQVVLDGINNGFYGDEGTEEFKSVFSSPSSLMKYNTANADKFQPMADYLSNGYSRAVSNPYFQDSINTMFNNQWGTTKGKQEFDLNGYQGKLLMANTMLADKNCELIDDQIKTNAELRKVYTQQVSNMLKEEGYIIAQTNFLEGPQTKYYDALIDQTAEQTKTIENQNILMNPLVNATKEHMSALTATEAKQLEVYIGMWNNIDTKQLATWHQEQMKNNAEYNSIMTKCAVGVAYDAQRLRDDPNFLDSTFTDIHGDITNRNLLAFQTLGIYDATTEYWNSLMAKREFKWYPGKVAAGIVKDVTAMAF